MYSNIAINDKFLVKSRTKEGLYPVTNVTPKRFTVGGYTFNKESGSQVGGEVYLTVTIQKATEEIEIEFNLKLKRFKLVRDLSKVNFDSLTLEQLQKVKSLIDGFSNTK